MMVVKKIVGKLLEEKEKLKWWFEQEIDDEEEYDKEGDGGKDAKDGLAKQGNDSLRMKVGGSKIQKKRRNNVLDGRRVSLIWTIRRDTICQLLKSPPIGKDTLLHREHQEFEQNLQESRRRVDFE
ncbi:hypothetical protein Tco_0861269 [Tanacetum coccineum]|uniref:Uncharacterized protein n=1 Tax=Tanacetum coccineum TaxID=301880 RepID=A0ABQ5BK93_9ASTR